MSYLDNSRITFSGDFQADVSTVNNDVRHYDLQTWEARFQKMQDQHATNGWWNPMGSGAYRLLSCAVTGTGGAHDAADPVIGARVQGAADRPPGKLVDLDPQWQMASTIFGLIVRLVDQGGDELIVGRFEPTPFRDIFFGRQLPESPDVDRIQNGSAVFQSVLTEVEFGPKAAQSPALSALKIASAAGLLSVRLLTFGYYTSATHPRFTLGRIAGAIGPYFAGSPRTCVLGRRFAPVGRGGFFDAISNDDGSSVTLDLANALPLADTMGALGDIGPLSLALLNAGGHPTELAKIDYLAKDWLAETSGIVDAPIPAAQAANVATKRLALIAGGRVIAQETPAGLNVRADNFVSRLDPAKGKDATTSVSIFASQFGKPKAGVEISIIDVGPVPDLGGDNDSRPTKPKAAIPDANVPAKAIKHPAKVITGVDGKAELKISASSPGNPRGYVDGQIYLRKYTTQGLDLKKDQHSLDFVILHVRDAFEAPQHPRWQDVGPIFAQFGNLYPIMSHRLIDLSSPDAVAENKEILTLALSLPIEDPNHMPVTRDLSDAKREMILAYLAQLPARPATPRVSQPAAPAVEPAAKVPPNIAGKNAFAAQLRKVGLMIEEE